MDLERKYTPGVPAKYQWHNPEVKAKLTPHLALITTRPLLLYGAPGGGKTRLGRLLPHMICLDLDPSMDMKHTHGSGMTVAKVADMLDFCKRRALNDMGMNVVTIEEVDDVPVSVMNALKGFLDEINEMPVPTLVIMTTNNVTKISSPVRDRCELVYVGLPSPATLLPFAKTILSTEGVTVDENLLLAILQHNADDGLSYREFFKRLTRLIARIP